MALSVDYFYSLTPRQFYNIQKGFFEKEDLQLKTSWEQTRKLFFGVLKPHLKKSTIKEFELMPFPWDDSSEQENSIQKTDSAEEIEAVKERWKLRDQKKKTKIDGGISRD